MGRKVKKTRGEIHRGKWRGVVERYVARQAEISGEGDGEEETVKMKWKEMGRGRVGSGEGQGGNWGGELEGVRRQTLR